MTVTQPLRDERKELIPHIERSASSRTGLATFRSRVRHGVEDAYTFLTQHLIPHAEAEERALYP